MAIHCERGDLGERTGLTLSDFTITNGTGGSFTGSAAAYSFVVTPTTEGAALLHCHQTDVSMRQVTRMRQANTLSVTYDATAPTITLSGAPAGRDVQRSR